MKHILLILIFFLLNCKNHSWKKVKKHSDAILYVMGMNAVYYLLCHRKLVWDFRDPHFSMLFIRIINVIFTTPLFLLLFLCKLPKKHLTPYLIKWAIYSTLVEWLAIRLNMITYQYGWNLLWTWLLYFKMYLYTHLLKKRNAIVIPLTVLSTYMFGAAFHMPWTEGQVRRPHIFLEKDRSNRDGAWHI